MSRGKLKATAVVGAVLLALGCILGWYGFGTIMRYMIRKEALLVNGTRGFRIWQEPTKASTVYMQFILFNITNGDQVLNEGKKPIIQEVGPFSYRKKIVRENIVWSNTSTKVSYNQVTHYYFDAETSGRGITEHTNVTIINLPMLLLKQRLSSNFMISLALSALGVDLNDVEVFPSVSVRNLLFDGLPSKILSQLSAEIIDLMCSIRNCGSDRDIAQLKLGRFRPAKYNGSSSDLMTIGTGVGGMDEYASVLLYKGSDHLSNWGSKYCNMINGTDGNIYPPGMYDNRRIYLFNKYLCRSLYLDYEKDVDYYGIRTRRFTPPRALLENPSANPDNHCFCTNEETCPKTGALYLGSCKSGAPIVASTPHFFNGDESYVHDVFGLTPDKQLHQTYVDIEPMTGAPLSGANRIQINLQLRPFKTMSGLEKLPDILLPIMYTNETATISEEKAEKLKRAIHWPQYWMRVIHWLLVSAGGLLLLVAIVGMLRARGHQQREFAVQEKVNLEVIR